MHALDSVSNIFVIIHFSPFDCVLFVQYEFMAFFRGTFADATTTITMHLLEDHATQWANATHVGFGLLGEQGAESIHAKFNRLGLAFAPITVAVHSKRTPFKYRATNSCCYSSTNKENKINTNLALLILISCTYMCSYITF